MPSHTLDQFEEERATRAPAPAVHEDPHAHDRMADDGGPIPEALEKITAAVTPTVSPTAADYSQDIELILATPPTTRRLLTLLTSDERKEFPITTGVLDYFPDAIALVANVSFRGNQKHNPGQKLHWARGKSMDHEDCIARHTIERDAVEDNVMHAANRAWRALAALQEMAEARWNLDAPRGVR